MSVTEQASAGERQPKLGEWIRHMPPPTQDIPQADNNQAEPAKTGDGHDVVLNTPRQVADYVAGMPLDKWCSSADSRPGLTEQTELEKNTERPKWYGSKSGQDVIDVAEDFGIVDNAYKFNMLKYLLRGGKKAGNSELQDMTKIKVYLERYIEKLSLGE